jgi:hypothetical protein
MDPDREQHIRERAYQLWEKAGQPPGGADEYWYEAERQLSDESRSGGLREDPATFGTGAGDDSQLGVPEPSNNPANAGKPTRRGAR